MSHASKKKARRSVRKPATSIAPLGMVAIFAAIQSDEYVSEHATTNVDIYAAVPAAILQKPADLVEIIKAAADREYPGDGFGVYGTDRASECCELLPIANGGAR